ncbi:Calcineurin-like phosphoesterase [Anatilimnocola aggregata]|uniref:Calcineurin-like phosphoesterase n=1 Tax=Anatilimnocola aggregata TaxID=2528021 RepID=A0A517YIM4_9BACT|nr:metallophosphoesterase [Anatilimnocola aggregata]QDU30064.1 Calcineurin-like phosphoesterase [Anatilimnocola aggregata]
MQLTRREILGTLAGASASLALRPAWAADKQKPVAFALIGDTHYLANKESPGEMFADSAVVTSQLVQTLNSLPGKAISAEAGGGEVAPIDGVIHAGDLIDTGDKSGGVHEKMQQTEWEAFTADFGLTGNDGKLKFPVYEVHGNHDGPRGTGIAIDGIKQRNKKRAGVKNVSANGQHYSWDWGTAGNQVHFINLGIVVGSTKDKSQPRRYNPLDSLEFLLDDLQKSVGESGRPVVITHHIDVQRYSGPCEMDEKNAGKEWHPCDARSFHAAIAGYNVVAILYGHTHARNVLKWNGTATKADRGFDLFNVDNGAHFRSDAQAFFYFEIAPGKLTVRELATTDRWQTSKWTPQVWQRDLKVAKS